MLFFTKGSVINNQQEENCTDNVWVFDLRTIMTSFGKRTPFGQEHLKPFEAVYGDNPNGQSPRKEGEWSFDVQDARVTREPGTAGAPHSDKIDLPEEVKVLLR